MTLPAASTLNAFNGIFQAIRHHGFKRVFYQILVLGQAKVGNLVGVDENGNEYYENRLDYHGRDRWVLYKKWNFDATQVPPQYHQWLHRMTDDLPNAVVKDHQRFFTPSLHTENPTGTRGAFKTYNTVSSAAKFQSWAPVVRARSSA